MATIMTKKVDGRKNNGKTQVSKYNDKLPVKVYRLISQGLSLEKCASVIGVSGTTFFDWIKKHPALDDAVKQAQDSKKGEGAGTFRTYIFGRLSPEAKRIWKKIHRFEKCKKEYKIRALLEKSGKYIRQQIFLYAIVASNFNISLALRKACLSLTQYQNWITVDPDFASLINEINWHKANYFESALMRLVKQGDSPAILFANRTFNRSRGYNDKVEVDVQVTDRREAVPVKELLAQLPVEHRKLLQQAFRDKRLKSVDANNGDDVKMLTDLSDTDIEIRDIIDSEDRT